MSLVLSPSQTIGPMWGYALIFPGCEQMVEPATPGAIALEGILTDGAGPVVYPHAMLELWNDTLWARSRVDTEGRFEFLIAKPAPSTMPDGTAFAPYFNVAIFAPGLLKYLLTRMYFPDEEQANAADPLLRQVPAQDRHTLVAQVGEGGLRHDICLQGANETAFFDCQ